MKGLKHGMRRHLRILFLTALVITLAAAGCGDDDEPSSPTATGNGAAPSTGTLEGSLTVFAAASLTEALNLTEDDLVAENPGLDITYSFAGSQQLVAQITAGAPADVVATADEASMARLVDAGLVDPPRVFARNKLQVVVAPGNPKGITGLAGLADGDVKVVLADPSVPVGRYTRQALDAAGVSVSPVSLELDVKAVVRRVSSGEADAGVAYVTDVAAAGDSVAGVDIPDDQNVVARYPAAVVGTTGNRAAAEAYVDELVRGAGQAALLAQGFLPG